MLCRRAQELYRALRDMRASGDEIEDRPRADTRTEIRDNRGVERIKVPHLLIEGIVCLIGNLHIIQCRYTRMDARAQHDLLRLLDLRPCLARNQSRVTGAEPRNGQSIVIHAALL